MISDARPAFATIAGTFFRIMLARDSHRVLAGAAAPQGRYHHGGQAALYVSPRPEWAWKAVEPYVWPGDPARAVLQIRIGTARIVDIRDRALCAALDIDPAHSDLPWEPQLALGTQPATWGVSDRAREAGADGLIYTARTAPTRWHLVLFRWNDGGGPAVDLAPRT